MGAGRLVATMKVRLRVGETIAEKAITDQDVFAAFSVGLSVGVTHGRALLLYADPNAQGAYYVYAKKL